MTFKEARAQARECRGGLNCLGRFKDGGWFVGDYADPRCIYWVNWNGTLEPLKTLYAQTYYKNYLKKSQKKA